MIKNEPRERLALDSTDGAQLVQVVYDVHGVHGYSQLLGASGHRELHFEVVREDGQLASSDAAAVTHTALSQRVALVLRKVKLLQVPMSQRRRQPTNHEHIVLGLAVRSLDGCRVLRAQRRQRRGNFARSSSRLVVDFSCGLSTAESGATDRRHRGTAAELRHHLNQLSGLRCSASAAS